MPALPSDANTIAVPLTHSESNPNHKANCSRTCTVALATIIPIVFLTLIFTIAFLVWGKPYLARRRQEKAEREAVKDKLAEEESVGSSDVSSLDGDVHRLNEERMEKGRREQARRREEGHEHDHVFLKCFGGHYIAISSEDSEEKPPENIEISTTAWCINWALKRMQNG
ncbi:MAG: hypothetical protein Q9213_005448 [Squamulea squamosa]